MKILIKSLLSFFVAFLITAVYAQPVVHEADHMHALTFGVTIHRQYLDPHQSVAATQSNFEHFVDNLSKQLKTPIKLVVFSEPMAAVNALENGKIDLAYINIMPLAKAVTSNQSITPLVTVLNWNADKTQKIDTYSSYLVTSANNKSINKVADLKDIKFGFAKDSASGYYLPAYYLQKNNITYSFHFFDNQYDAVRALQQGKVSVIAWWDVHGQLDRNKLSLKTIDTIAHIPNPVIAAAKTVSAEQLTNIKQALANLPSTAYTGLTFVGVENYNPAVYAAVFHAVKTVKGPSA